MTLEHVDVFELQPLQTRLHRVEDVLAKQKSIPDIFFKIVRGSTHLAGETVLVDIPALVEILGCRSMAVTADGDGVVHLLASVRHHGPSCQK